MFAVERTVEAWSHFYQPGINFSSHLATFLTPAFNVVGMVAEPITGFLGLGFLFATMANVTGGTTGGNALDAFGLG